MWSDEQINDAVQLLWNASESGNLCKVTDKEKEPTETYIVANDVTYTDELYLKALEKLLSDRKLETNGTKDDRESFRRAASKATK